MTMILHGAPPLLGGFGIPKVLKRAASKTITLAKNSGIPVVSDIASAARSVSNAVSPPKQAVVPTEPPPTNNPLGTSFMPRLDEVTGGNGKLLLLGGGALLVGVLVFKSTKGS